LEGVKTEKVGMHASANHAAGLNKALDHVATRYVLFLDPDFFLVREKWITDAVAHMQTRRLSFFGAPYHPDRYYEYRYFPSILCMLVDLEQVPRSRLNFAPEVD